MTQMATETAEGTVESSDGQNSESYERAKKRVDARRSFLYTLGLYVIVNIALFLINLITLSDGGWWFYWVTIFWGVGMLFWGYQTFAGTSPQAMDRREQKIQRYMDQERRHGGPVEN